MWEVNIIENEIEVSFSGENFDDYKSIMKSNGLIFNSRKKVWTTSSPKLFKDKVLPILQSIEPGKVNVNKLSKLAEKEELELDQTYFFRNKLDLDSVKLPSIKGKPPYEDFQIDCIKKGICQNRYGLFLQMGTGKTFIVVSILNQLFKQNKINKVLVVCPGEALYNWRRELKRFSTFAEDNESILISTANKNRDPLQDLEKPVYVMTYRHFLTLSDDYYQKKNNRKSTKYIKPTIPWNEWGTSRAIILDESHNAKNPQARQTKVLSLHKKYFEYRYLLTGTPTPNEFGEIYSQIRFLDEKVIPEKSYYHWIGKVAHIGNRFSAYAVNKEKGDNGYKSEEVEEEQKKISPLVTRYKSNEVLELPDLMIKPYYTELTDIQKEIYQHIVNYVIYKVKEENEGRLVPKKVFNQFAFIVQAYENACLLKGKVDPVYSSKLNKLIEKFKFDNKHHAKLSIVDSLLEEYLNEQKKKVAIMDYHPLTIEQIVERYKKYNPVFIHGGSTPKEKSKDEHRDQTIEKFKHDKNCNLLVGSSMVLSTAINLTECTRVIYFSRNFSYLDWSQSIKRFHRIGSSEPVIINPIISENTLEERVETALRNKKDLDDTIFSKDYLTQEEWKKIFTGNSL